MYVFPRDHYNVIPIESLTGKWKRLHPAEIEQCDQRITQSIADRNTQALYPLVYKAFSKWPYSDILQSTGHGTLHHVGDPFWGDETNVWGRMLMHIRLHMFGYYEEELPF